MSQTMQPMSVDELKQMAAVIRCDIIEMICTAGAGHPGGSLSATDIVTALYFRMMRIDPMNPRWPERDRFILSKGHACPVWYAALAERGFYDKSHLGTLRRMGSILQGHPDMNKVPGIDMTTGSLGQGLSVGIGMALAGRLQELDFHVWVVIGDGESQEGSVWEAAFGWNVAEIDGHDMSAIVAALEGAKEHRGSPTIIIAQTVKGKGVSYMENVCEWHGKAPCREEADKALQEIRR